MLIPCQLDHYLLPLCRLVKGRDLQSVIEAVQRKVVSKSTTKSEVAALRAWIWQLTLHVAYALSQVCACHLKALHLILRSAVCSSSGASSELFHCISTPLRQATSAVVACLLESMHTC